MSDAFDAPTVREAVILAALERLETRPTRLVDTFALGCVLQSARLVEASLMKLDREPLARERHLSKIGSKTKERLQDIKDDDMFLGLTIGQIRKFYKVHRQTSLFFCFGRPKRLETDRPLPVFNIFFKKKNIFQWEKLVDEGKKTWYQLATENKVRLFVMLVCGL